MEILAKLTYRKYPKMKGILNTFMLLTTFAASNVIFSTAQAANLRPLVVIESSLDSTLIARRDSKPKIKIQFTKSSSMLRKFKPIKFRAGKYTHTLGSNEMKSILKKHHPKAYDKRDKDVETFFPRKTKTRNIVKAISFIYKQNRHHISQGKTPVMGVYKNKKYELGYDGRGRILHFVPKK
jgi:hypothetical protein